MFIIDFVRMVWDKIYSFDLTTYMAAAVGWIFLVALLSIIVRNSA